MKIESFKKLFFLNLRSKKIKYPKLNYCFKRTYTHKKSAL